MLRAGHHAAVHPFGQHDRVQRLGRGDWAIRALSDVTALEEQGPVSLWLKQPASGPLHLHLEGNSSPLSPPRRHGFYTAQEPHLNSLHPQTVRKCVFMSRVLMFLFSLGLLSLSLSKIEDRLEVDACSVEVSQQGGPRTPVYNERVMQNATRFLLWDIYFSLYWSRSVSAR